MNLHEYAKNEAVSSICSGEIAGLEMLQSDWLRPFWSISQKQALWDMGIVQEHSK